MKKIFEVKKTLLTFNRVSLTLGLCPALYLCFAWWFNSLGANAIESLIHLSGQWSLFFLFLTLLITPLTRYIPIIEVRSIRRQLGLFCFFYASIHLGVYIGLDFYFDWVEIYYDVINNKYIVVGLMAVFFLLLLALTSTRNWRKRLKKNWQRLHNLVYIIFLLAMLHFYWLTKADYTEAVLYSVMIGSLLAERLWHRYVHIRK